MRLTHIIFVLLFPCLIWELSCQSENAGIVPPQQPSTPSGADSCQVSEGGWNLPISEIIDSGVGKDGIPALESPSFIPVQEATYLQEEAIVIGVKVGSELRAYPHNILDRHEIINDQISGENLAISLCPLTSTSLVFPRKVTGDVTTFGVSGLIYQSNLIMYDRLSDTHWTQMLLEGNQGQEVCETLDLFPSLEMTWRQWKDWYPDSWVVSTETGFDRNYRAPALSALVNEQSSLLYPVTPLDSRLPSFERVYGVITPSSTYVYPLKELGDELTLIQDEGPGSVVIVGNGQERFAVGYERKLVNGPLLEFQLVEGEGERILVDQEGTYWNIWGEGVAGPRTGARLQTLRAYQGYWFAFGAMFSDVVIYDPSGVDG